MIKGAIFDIDGTILDSMYVWEQAGELFLLDLGIVAEPDLSKKLSNMSMLQGAEFLKERYSLKLNVRDIINGINRTIKDFYYYNVQLKKGVERLLKAMQESGIKIVAATASDRRVIEKALGRLKIIDYFDRLFTCNEIGAGKDEPDIFLAAAGFMDTLPNETLVFEDALYAIKTAKAAGFKVIGVFDASSFENTDEIKQISDIYIEGLDELDDINSLF